MNSTAFEVHHRDRKVTACLVYLDRRKNRAGLTDADVLRIVESFTEGGWAQLAREAMQKPLSEKSRAVLLDRLRGRLS